MEGLKGKYSYCLVDHVERQILYDQPCWIARCNDNSTVIFHSRVTTGEEIYYTPYYENDDAVTIHGYIKKIENIIP